jgi:hypothetical protein
VGLEDEIFALWNYTRALAAYAKEGNSAKSKSLLNHAMDKNPIVPSLLLCWEATQTGLGTHTLVSIGRQTEANDYALDNRIYWLECEGGLGMWSHNFHSD